MARAQLQALSPPVLGPIRSWAARYQQSWDSLQWLTMFCSGCLKSKSAYVLNKTEYRNKPKEGNYNPL